MRKELGNLIGLGALVVACMGMAILALPAMAFAQSTEPPVPATMAAQGQAAGIALIVINKPIFALPKAGSLLLSASPHPVGGSVVVSGVKRFRIVFPPASKAGSLSLSGPPSGPRGEWKPRRWYKTSSLGPAGAKIGIQWQRSAGAMGAAPAPTRAAEISVNSVTGTVRITADSVLGAGGRGIGRGRTALEQMVVDVRLESGRAERIQFLPARPQDRTVLLGPSTPSIIPVRVPQEIAAAGIITQLSLAVGAFRARGGEIFHLSGQSTSTDDRIKMAWVNLLGDTQPKRKPVADKLGRVEFSLVGGRIKNNYARDARLASLYTARLQSYLRSLSKEQSAGDYRAKRLQREVKYLLVEIAARSSRLHSLRLIALCVELYPGGPVVETVTYTRATAATQPGGRQPAGTQPTEKKNGAAAGF